MGRVKLHVKRIENNSGRQTTYCKRKNGLFKKAQELSILCDIDIVLLAFSPSGKPTLYTGENRSIEEIIEKFSQLPPWERAKRKLESLEALKKTYKKSDHDVNIQDFVGPSYKSVEDLTTEVNLLQTQIFEARKKLGYWSNLDKIDSTEHLEEMEISLHKSLHQIRTHKVNLERQQQMEIQSANQFKDGMHLPFSWALEERLQPFSWFPNDYNQHVISSDELNLITQRDSESSAGTSLGSYCGISDPSEKVDRTKIGQENDIMNECFGPTESSSLQLNENLQVYEQQIYPSYNFGVLCDKKFQPTEEMNVEENTLDYFIDRKFEVPFFGYDPTHHGWASTSETFSLAMFDELLYPQASFSSMHS